MKSLATTRMSSKGQIVIELLIIYAEIYQPEKLKEPIFHDPDDDKFIACALAAKVKIIVSGDQDFLNISGYQGIHVMKPSFFVKKSILN